MARDYQARKYIADRSAEYNDSRLTAALVKAFDIIYNNQEPDGCMSNSVALHIILRSFGYDPKLCYGLCITPAGNEMYHAWLELDGKVLDLAIYGNSHFSRFWHEDPVGPVVFEKYTDTAVKYGDHIFDDDWDECMISKIVGMGSVSGYVSRAPHVNHPSGNGMWKVIFSILDETYTDARRQELERFVSKEAF